MFVQFFDSSVDEPPFREYEGENLVVDISFDNVLLDGRLIATMSRGGEFRYFFLEDDTHDRKWVRFMRTSTHAYVPRLKPQIPYQQPHCNKCGSVLHTYADGNTQWTHCPVCAPVDSVVSNDTVLEPHEVL